MTRIVRDVFMAFLPSVRHLGTLEMPTAPFVLFIGADTADASTEDLADAARTALRKGAVYVLCWGPGCERLEDIFDEDSVQQDLTLSKPVVMTTSHPNDTIIEALEFMNSFAVPDQVYASECHTAVVVIAANIDWYNEAQNCLEDLLASN